MNTLLLGVAWQRGLVPVGQAALLRAIELNGADMALNRRAFLWGRILADRPELADEILRPRRRHLPATHRGPGRGACRACSRSISRRSMRDSYRGLMRDVIARETRRVRQPRQAVARRGRGAVPRHGVQGRIRGGAAARAKPRMATKPVFHLAPPLLARTDPATGRPRKMAVPGWLALPLFRALRHGKILRGTRLDPFGWLAERRHERALRDSLCCRSACSAGGVAAGYAGHRSGAGRAAGHDPRLRAGEGCEPGEGGGAAGDVAGTACGAAGNGAGRGVATAHFPLPRLREGLGEGATCRTHHPPLAPPASAGGGITLYSAAARTCSTSRIDTTTLIASSMRSRA